MMLLPVYATVVREPLRTALNVLAVGAAVALVLAFDGFRVGLYEPHVTCSGFELLREENVYLGIVKAIEARRPARGASLAGLPGDR